MTYPTHFAEGAKSVSGYAPQAASAGAIAGAAIDRFGYQSCVLLAKAGAATGTPTTQTFDAKLQDSADGTTGWADLVGAATTQITAANGEQHKNVDLTGARRYIRVA
ncbi:MAG: hypothetical protein JWN15_3148, partial [Firmicutes bacterium]|nr:hypothetical protein [Bacillota bacterium]